MKPTFGSVEFYRECFSDIICEVGISEDPEVNYLEGMKVLAGFDAAITSWLEYHKTQVKTYSELRDEFLGFSFAKYDKSDDEEAEALPEIPSIPSSLH